MSTNPYAPPNEVGASVPQLPMSRQILRAAATIAWKLVLPAIVFMAGPESHVRWGEEYTGPGMNQVDVLFAVAAASFGLAALLFAAFIVTGIWLHRRSLKLHASIDVALFLLALATAVLAGVTARVE